MKRHIGKIIGCLGLVLLVFSRPLVEYLAPRFAENSQGPVYTASGGLTRSGFKTASIAVYGLILVLVGTGVAVEVVLSFKAYKQRTQQDEYV